MVDSAPPHWAPRSGLGVYSRQKLLLWLLLRSTLLQLSKVKIASGFGWWSSPSLSTGAGMSRQLDLIDYSLMRTPWKLWQASRMCFAAGCVWAVETGWRAFCLWLFFFFFIYSTAGACWGGSCWVGPEGDGRHRERANHGSRRRDYKWREMDNYGIDSGRSIQLSDR